IIAANHHALGEYGLFCENAENLLFTENESNLQRLWGVPNQTRFVKDSINDYVVHDKHDAVNPAKAGTKAAEHYEFLIAANESVSIRLRLRKVAAAVEGGAPA